MLGFWITTVALFGFFLAGCACCGTACTLCSDSFAYTAGEDTNVNGLSSCGWTEIVADWTIKTNRLKVSGTAYSIIRCDTTHTNEQISVSVKPSSPSGYGRWRIILDYNSTSDHAWAELKLEATGNTLSVGQNLLGTDTTHTSVAAYGVLGGTLTACITDAGHIRASWGSTRVDDDVPPGFPLTTGTVGLGTGNSTVEHWFTDFTAEKAEPSNLCDSCLPQCAVGLCPDDNDLPATLTVVVAGIANGTCITCNPYNGTYIMTATGTACRWTYTSGVNCSGVTRLYEATIITGRLGRFRIDSAVGAINQRILWSETTAAVPDNCDTPWPALNVNAGFAAPFFECNTAVATADI